MSHLSQVEIACPHCKQPVEVELWTTMNVKEDPELKDMLLGGEINMVECAACKEVFYAESFILYHDPDNQVLGFVYPAEQREMGPLISEKTLVDFEREQAEGPAHLRLDYRPVVFFGLNELVSFVETDEEVALQSEVAEAIATQQGWPFRKVAPFVARSQGLPRVLPVSGDDETGTRGVLEGLRRLVEHNDRLTVYTDAYRRLSADPAVAVRLS